MSKKPFVSNDERPLTGNSSGKYNMNFIDETNDLASYCNGSSQLPPEVEQLINQYFETINFSQYTESNPKNHFVPAMNLCESKLFGHGNLRNKEKKGNSKDQSKQKQNAFNHCSVCTEDFAQNEEIKVLPCGHLFHKSCIKPWFQVNSKCPNCRFDIYDGK